MNRPVTPETIRRDVRPVVARTGGQVPGWLLLGIATLGGVLLFMVLDGRRRAATAPTTEVRVADDVQPSSILPPLLLAPDSSPPAVVTPAAESRTTQQQQVQGSHPVPPPRPQPPPSAVYQPQAPYIPPQQPAYLPAQPAVLPPVPASSGPALVIDTTAAPADAEAGAAPPAVAARLSRPATTIAQGTLIPAVLETALDSTRPGHVRAIVSQDIKGFDGGAVLIPRGSRVFGDYQADMAAGQNRALVQWTRLVRPDGVTIALASPAADMEGRAGIEGRVNSHLLQRFGGALMQSVLNVGGALIGQSLNRDSSVIIALPTAGGAAPVAAPQGPQPTLRVDAGTRLTVFVARDLELPPAGRRP